MKKFKSVPLASSLPMFYIAGILFFLFFIWYLIQTDQIGPIFLFVIFIILILWFLIATWRQTMVTIVVQEKMLLAKTPFCRDIVMEYDRCNVGMDYHVQNGGKIWWIYLCYGWLPPYKSKNPANRMNSLKCRDGFIRIMYRDEVYDALLEVLPKKQKTQLICASRLMGPEGQGHIIF